MITRGPETIVVQGDPWPSKQTNSLQNLLLLFCLLSLFAT